MISSSSYFGANVLHPRTISPVIQYGIPIIIWNIFDTSASGTNICHPSIIENEDRKIFKNLCLGLYNDKQFGTCKCGRNLNGWCSSYIYETDIFNCVCHFVCWASFSGCSHFKLQYFDCCWPENGKALQDSVPPFSMHWLRPT
ncbi:Bifunctional aspartokinase/homoserine dehydrogenase 1, chloroplastic [Trifolium repens]|nr:Bifunctional aspartokinase/homoserine dehydrogenase 1, chloroplastic [Trifolium repens]